MEKKQIKNGLSTEVNDQCKRNTFWSYEENQGGLNWKTNMKVSEERERKVWLDRIHEFFNKRKMRNSKNKRQCIH